MLRSAGLSLVLVALLACAPATSQTRPEAGAAPPALAIESLAPSLDELGNATYRGVEEAAGTFTLSRGRWQGQPYSPGGASAPSVTLVHDFRLVGDIDGDGRQEAAVLLAGAAGGSGETIYLAVVRRAGGGLENVATTSLGDRVQVRDARIDGRRIVVDVVQAGDQDAACCPGDLVTRTWELRQDGLEEGPPIRTGRLSVAALAGTAWILRSWTWNEPASIEPVVTLEFDANRVVGRSGCNAYVAPVKAGSQPGDLQVGPVGSTRKACAKRDMALESRFSRQLAGVRQMRFAGGRLALAFTNPDGSFDTMLFERRAVR